MEGDKSRSEIYLAKSRELEARSKMFHEVLLELILVDGASRAIIGNDEPAHSLEATENV